MIVRPQGFLAISAALLAAACSDPTLPSDLRPDGPPEVLTVLVMDDPFGALETATFCKTQGPDDQQGAAGSDAGDPQRPGQVDGPIAAGLVTVQLCPDDLTMGVPEVTDAVPTAWYARIVFDELLDPSVEDLVPITDGSGNPTGNSAGTLMNTQPVTLSCGGVDVPYDGYYQPSGNKLTWPVGPSLFIQALDPTTVPTGAECSLAIKSGAVKDEQGNAVPMDQLGPWTFAVSSLAMVASVPASAVPDPTMLDQVDPTTPLELTFNDLIDPASIPASEIELFSGAGSDCTGGSAVGSNTIVFQVESDGSDADDPTSVEIADGNALGSADPTDPTNLGAVDYLVPSTIYRLGFAAGATVSDVAGGSAALAFPPDLSSGSAVPVTELCFATTDGM
jgi:hypothetical protein